MSIMGNGFYRDYAKYEVEPEWIRNERYDYCEDFREDLGDNSAHWLQKISRALFSFML